MQMRNATALAAMHYEIDLAGTALDRLTPQSGAQFSRVFERAILVRRRRKVIGTSAHNRPCGWFAGDRRKLVLVAGFPAGEASSGDGGVCPGAIIERIRLTRKAPPSAKRSASRAFC